MTSQVKIVGKKKKTGLRPLVGLILGLAVGVISWFLAPMVLEWLLSQNRRFGAGIDPNLVRAGITAVLFLVFITIGGLIIAAATPRKMTNVKETDLMKEREQMRIHDVAVKKRQQKLNRQMRQEVQARTDTNRERFKE